MAYGTLPLESRLKEYIKDYSLENVMDLEKVAACFEDLRKAFGVDLLLTQRHGEHVVAAGDFDVFCPDVVNDPGRRIRAAGRTIGHLYVRLRDAEEPELINRLLDHIVDIYSNMCNKHYLYRETAIYADELEEKIEKELYRAKRGEHVDALTGTLSKTYFGDRLKKMEETGIAPAAVICANINDWKFVYDHFGVEESDRLIKTVAGIIREQSEDSYLIGRVDGDVFDIVIPVPQENEAEDFCRRIQQACRDYIDPVLAPSIAVGIVYRTNVEESFRDKFSDAEYEMFRDKYEIKQTPGYQERLTHGL